MPKRLQFPRPMMRYSIFRRAVSLLTAYFLALPAIPPFILKNHFSALLVDASRKHILALEPTDFFAAHPQDRHSLRSALESDVIFFESTAYVFSQFAACLSWQFALSVDRGRPDKHSANICIFQTVAYPGEYHPDALLPIFLIF